MRRDTTFALPQSVDFPTAILHLRNSGYSLLSVSRLICQAESTVRGWLQGSHPEYDSGNAFVCFYEQVLGKPIPKKPFVVVVAANHFA